MDILSSPLSLSLLLLFFIFTDFFTPQVLLNLSGPPDRTNILFLENDKTYVVYGTKVTCMSDICHIVSEDGFRQCTTDHRDSTHGETNLKRSHSNRLKDFYWSIIDDIPVWQKQCWWIETVTPCFRQSVSLIHLHFSH